MFLDVFDAGEEEVFQPWCGQSHETAASGVSDGAVNVFALPQSSEGYVLTARTKH